MSSIGKETNCRVTVNFSPHHPSDDPITITIDACSQTGALRDLTMARQKIESLMLGYLNIYNDGSKGRLVYDIALSCKGAHRPNNSTSRAVNTKSPFDGRYTWMTVLELPFRGENGRREYHTKYLLDSRLLGDIKNAGCAIKLCGGECGIPTKQCNPYVWLTGTNSKTVDQAAAMIKDAIKCHMDKCSYKCKVLNAST